MPIVDTQGAFRFYHINLQLTIDNSQSVALDVTITQSTRAMMDEILTAFGHVDILVNNAGT